MKDFLLKVVLIYKGHPKTFKSAKGSGRLFNFEVVDHFNRNREQFMDGEVIQCTIFGERVTRF